MFFTTTPSALTTGFGTSLDHPLRRRIYAQAGRSAADFIEKTVAAARTHAGVEAHITQDETQYSVTMDVPGVGKEHLSIRIEDAVVRIESKEGAPRHYRAAFEFDQKIDNAASNARLENGVLSLSLAKVMPVSKVAELAIS